MKQYMVVTPEYGTLIPILDDGTGPIEYGCDTFECDAQNAREAKVMAVRYWRTCLTRDPSNPRYARWILDHQEGNPFIGLKVYNMDLDDDEFNARYHPEMYVATQEGSKR